jgi:hypothetical protein
MSTESLRVSWAPLLIGASIVAAPARAEAELIWDGDASLGTGVFKAILGSGNCGDGSLTVVNDGTHGAVWRFNKPAGVNRCENHGIRVAGSPFKFLNNSTYFLGWWSRLSSTADNSATFQWKSFGDGQLQNAPVLLRMEGGRMTLIQRQPGGVQTTLWSRSIGVNTWNHFVLGLKLSSETRGGHVELWLNGVKQTFADGSDRFACRTFDSGNHNCPKWGIFGAAGNTITNFIDGLRVGTTFGDVGPTSKLALATGSGAGGDGVDPAAPNAASSTESGGVEGDDELRAAAVGCGVGGGVSAATGPAGPVLATAALVVAGLAGHCRRRRRRRRGS